MKWVICNHCENTHATIEEDPIVDWEPCEYCGENSWREENEDAPVKAQESSQLGFPYPPK